ncbi:MAG: DUF1998 domain-containing protein [Chloroflexi bacterium]|nr:DUF1998 domain-containing protein [Chloroflexota bacterium]
MACPRPGGLGFAERPYQLHGEPLRGAQTLVARCPCRDRCLCRDGCPACMGPVTAGGSEVKALTVRLVEALI